MKQLVGYPEKLFDDDFVNGLYERVCTVCLDLVIVRARMNVWDK